MAGAAPHATDFGRSPARMVLPSKPGLENAGVGGTNVSSVSAIDTGWYVPSWSPMPCGGPNDDVRWRGMGLARLMLTHCGRFLFRLRRRQRRRG